MRWRSPIRGPWLTSVFGAVLLAALPLVTVTGLLSYIAYGPQLGQAIPGDVGWLRLPAFQWPTDPAWLYQLNQGIHVVLGMAIIPVVLAKLWSVTPKLFTWPPIHSVAHALERLSLLILVGSILFELATGVLNIQYDYIFGFSFYSAHYFGAWVFIAAFIAHVCLKLPKMISSLRSRSLRTVLRTRLTETRPEPPDPDGLVSADPDPPTMSRRGALAMVGGGSALVLLLSAGQSIGGVFRPLSVLLPRGRVPGDGPNDFQVNRTAVAARISSDDTGEAWRLTLSGGDGDVTVSRAQLLAMPLHTADLPIACVEGWSTTQTWTGVRLAELANLAGVGDPTSARVASLQKSGTFNAATLQHNQVLAPDSLLALRVNGADLSLDHGFPARIIVPAMPGVHNTKWVRSIEFRT
ncbi:MAG: molybdopterin-dependent oxidoreductase [Brevibacterium sp.]|uniref:molybdopterin-dependent oxidoreductase n=1 Tax=Brevibacterium sandarakinum TaxID=629680 RepID=UPI00264BC461|nr:molybdopterin-dependent oxidoreductase [Brevibacterium sandarakinum]MDN5587698.1 molybdopterin-dependent oxidoreductase [Brevibacterium sp.]MDN5656457.1 molybdopterin-dependent oxidoreductase [Brevibacterium sandarakinum]